MTPTMPNHNTLYYGDNLPILRECIADESVDLVYLDPPFSSSRSYNVLFKDERGGNPKPRSPPSTTPGTGTPPPSGSSRR